MVSRRTVAFTFFRLVVLTGIVVAIYFYETHYKVDVLKPPGQFVPDPNRFTAPTPEQTRRYIDHLKGELLKNPGDPRTLRLLTVVCEIARDFEQSAQYATQWAAADPTNPEPYICFARMCGLRQMKHYPLSERQAIIASGLTAIRKALSITPKSLQALATAQQLSEEQSIAFLEEAAKETNPARIESARRAVDKCNASAKGYERLLQDAKQELNDEKQIHRSLGK